MRQQIVRHQYFQPLHEHPAILVRVLVSRSLPFNSETLKMMVHDLLAMTHTTLYSNLRRQRYRFS